MSTERAKRPRSGNFSNEEQAIAKRLCSQYDAAVTPEKFRTKECDKGKQKQLLDKAWNLFKIEADRQDVTRDSFTKLLSRIRVAEAARTSSSSSAPSTGVDATEDNDEEEAIRVQQRREREARRKATQTGNRPGPPPLNQLEADDIFPPSSKSKSKVNQSAGKKTPAIQRRGESAPPKRLTLHGIAQVRKQMLDILDCNPSCH